MNTYLDQIGSILNRASAALSAGDYIELLDEVCDDAEARELALREDDPDQD